MTSTIPAPQRLRGPYAKTAARREQILRTALEEFAVRGFRASSLREIADKVGLSKAGILHHFSSKEALLAAVLDERDAVSLTHSQGPTISGMLDGLREVVVENLTQPGLVRLFTTLSAEATDPDHPAHAYFVCRYTKARELFADTLRNAQVTGEVDPTIDPLIAGANLIAIVDGLQIQWLLDPTFDMLGAYDASITAFRKDLEGTAK